MILSVLFWNFNIKRGQRLVELTTDSERSAVLARIVRENAVDILVLAECTLPDHSLIDALQSVDPRFELPANPHDRIRFFTRFPGEWLEPWTADGRMAVRRLSIQGYQDILLAAFHYVDRRNNSAERQWRDLGPYRATVIEAERMADHTRTILFGDLNMNPFDRGLTDPVHGFGAMMTWELAEVHSEKKGPLRFYNPMWSLMGRAEAPGTYYWAQDEPENPYWHCLDGVLVRPTLRGIFLEDELRIVRRMHGVDGEVFDLIRLAETHWQVVYSDHLPILFRLLIPTEDEHA